MGTARAIAAVTPLLLALAAPLLLPDTRDGEKAPTRAGAATGARTPAVELIEASGLAVCGGGKVAVIGGDETTDRLWAVSLDDVSVRWELAFPPDTPMLDDIEALAPCGKNRLFVSCSQSRTKPRERSKPQRDRFALVTLSDDARRLVGIRVYERLRFHLATLLVGRGRDLFASPGAIIQNGPNRGGLNVEGLAWWKDDLLLGLRSPVAKGGAVVVPLHEPARLFEAGGQQHAPSFGAPIVLPTKPGEAIRDMAATDDGILLLLGGQSDAPGPGFRLARWRPETNQLQAIRAKGFDAIACPEGIALDPEGRLLVVQDQKPPLPETVLFRLRIEKP